jgi:hypothetical protein
MHNAAQTDVPAEAGLDQEEYRVGGQLATQGSKLLTTELYGRMGSPAHASLKALGTVAALSATAGSDATVSAFNVGA